MSASPSSESALAHLKSLRPLEGWSVQCDNATTKGVRLLRRSVPLTENYFLDIHYDQPSGQVVGILTNPKGGRSQGQILVDPSGKPCRKVSLIQVSTWDPKNKKGSTAPTSSGNLRDNNDTTRIQPLSDEQNKELLRYAGMLVLFLVFCRSLFTGFYIFVFPAVYLYMVQHCPSVGSFDPKKELKRVLRGHNLPDDDPNKPKGWLDTTLARVQASVFTELATGLGYEVKIITLVGMAHYASVKVPAAGMEYGWIGAIGKWHYVYSNELSDCSKQGQ